MIINKNINKNRIKLSIYYFKKYITCQTNKLICVYKTVFNSASNLNY